MAEKNKEDNKFSHGIFYYVFLIIAIILAATYRTNDFSDNKYVLLEMMSNNSMEWEISTTPIPISQTSSLIKSILAKEMENVPEELKYLTGLDTIKINIVRQFLNKERLQKIMEYCNSDNNKVTCEKYINEKDPEFGITPLHLAYGSGDLLAVEYLKSIGANTELIDSAGRKPFNLSFSNFVHNTKNYARKSGNKCEIPTVVINHINDFKEVKRLINEGEPVLIKNSFQFLGNIEELQRIQLEKLINEYGNSKVTVGEVPYANVFRLNHSINTLEDYYKNHVLIKRDEPLYIFQKNEKMNEIGLSLLSKLIENTFPTPQLICPVEYNKGGSESIHFYLGTYGSGAPFHIHADAVNLVVFGSKKWYIYPPIQSVYSRKHITRWLNEDYKLLNEDEKPLECTQEVGDVIYVSIYFNDLPLIKTKTKVPFDWSHAVLNVGEQTFGFALELLNRREVLFSLPSSYKSCNLY